MSVTLERQREAQHKWLRQRTLSLQEIGKIPKVANRRRRNKAKKSLKFHLETYYPHVFTLGWAPFHLKLIESIERIIHDGGWLAMALPRGGGKSSIAEGAVMWAVMHGHKRWPVLIGATQQKAQKRLANIKVELRTNMRLAEDFPEICFPIWKLGRSTRRAEGQKHDGQPTAIEWGMDQIALPTIKGSAVSGSRISALGLTGDVRGLSEKTESLESLRPDFAIPDDPSTRESSKSRVQSEYRAAIITGDVAYLNGPTERMSVIMPCTVIYGGDLADQMLDRTLNPEWHGERHKLMESPPDRQDLWDQYAELRRELLRLDMPLDKCNEFYQQHRAAMDKGAKVTWEDRKNDSELSAIQHAMNLRIRDFASFQAEAQNEPLENHDQDIIKASPVEIIQKQNHCEHNRIPQFADVLVAHVDVQQRVLYYAVGGGSKASFEVAIQDYGTLPDQRRNYFSYGPDVLSIQDAFADERLEVQLYKAIQGCIAKLATAVYMREDGAEMKVSRILVDCGWERTTVFRACHESPFAQMVLPCRGMSVRAKDTPFGLRPQKVGEQKGHEYVIKPHPEDKAVRYMQINVNYWKSQLHIGFKTAAGPGCVSLFKTRPERHRMIADHCNAESVTRVTAADNTVDEWDEKPNKPDNHHFDNLVGVLAGLSEQGCIMPASQEIAQKRKRKVRVINKAAVQNRRRR